MGQHLNILHAFSATTDGRTEIDDRGDVTAQVFEISHSPLNEGRRSRFRSSLAG